MKSSNIANKGMSNDGIANIIAKMDISSHDSHFFRVSLTIQCNRLRHMIEIRTRIVSWEHFVAIVS